MAKSAWDHMTHPDALDQFAAIVAVRKFADSRSEAKAIVAVVFRTGKGTQPAEATALMAEAKATPGTAIAAKAKACSDLAAQYGLPATFDWTAIITAILTALSSCGL